MLELKITILIMPRRSISFEPGYYHLYNRGNDKNDIFHNPKDYGFFINILNYNRRVCCINIVCYCLMPNHFHLFIRTDENSRPVEFMKRIQMLYAKYLQENCGIVGHAFQGRYKAKPIIQENQFLYLSAYIHANPKSSSIVQNLRQWQWSSFLDYTGLRDGKLPEKDLILSYFASPNDYGEWVDFIGQDKLQKKLESLTLED